MAFDPNEHTVDEVNTYLDSADAAEVERVLGLEDSGKARVGVLSVSRDAEPDAEPEAPSDRPTATGYDWVRAKDPVSGHEFTTSAMLAEANHLTVLDKPATDEFGRVLPAKPNINKGVTPASEESA